jgi:hypothetical protein
MLGLSVAVPLSIVSILIALDYRGIISLHEIPLSIPRGLLVVALILPGLIPLRYLRWPVEWRLIAGLIYLISMFAVIPLYALIFACTFTGDCI